ncbi:MAG: hypothetical protein M1827_007156 [Pycnora praestabilis]|nr:MAG: hypothetical protein M1827_007156 [Pycnora praestabilis]
MHGLHHRLSKNRILSPTRLASIEPIVDRFGETLESPRERTCRSEIRSVAGEILETDGPQPAEYHIERNETIQEHGRIERSMIQARNGKDHCVELILQLSFLEQLNAIDRARQRVEKLRDERQGLVHNTTELRSKLRVITVRLTKVLEVLEGEPNPGESDVHVLVEELRAVDAKIESIQAPLKQREGLVNRATYELEAERVHLQAQLNHAVGQIVLAMKDASLMNMSEAPSLVSFVKDQVEAPPMGYHQRQPERTTVNDTPRLAAYEDLKIKDEKLMRLNDEFDERRDLYYELLWDLQVAHDNGDRLSETKVDFDVQYHYDSRILTRKLINAEAEYKEAKSVAKGLGLLKQYDSDQRSNFDDQVDDGYQDSFEVAMKESIDREYIERWADEVGRCTNNGDASKYNRQLLAEWEKLETVEEKTERP